ncbi:unnamed protein product [Staurois parvus]|uniref:Uncharacterized protein n=1 Tax=Staurois parvus TaxID=386267 RepID=A0ABN9BR50_9NEOB|nr:unnamed protein product [Staurois parvus]
MQGPGRPDIVNVGSWETRYNIVNAGSGRPDIVNAGPGRPDIVNAGSGETEDMNAGSWETRYSECRVRGDRI